MRSCLEIKTRKRTEDMTQRHGSCLACMRHGVPFPVLRKLTDKCSEVTRNGVSLTLCLHARPSFQTWGILGSEA